MAVIRHNANIESSVDALATMAGDVEQRSMSEVAEHFRRIGVDGIGGGTSGPREPFTQVEAVHRCVTFTAEAVSCMDLLVGTDRDQLVESGPIFNLIDQPNDHQDGGDFWYETVGWLLLTGRVHWVYTEMVGPRPTKILPVPGPMIRPVFEGGPHKTSGTLIGWLWRQPGERWSQAETLLPEQQRCLQLKSFNPERPHEGLAIVAVVRRKINQVYKADSANERSLDNDVQPGAIISPDHAVSDEQWRDFVARLREQHEGYRNRHRMMVTSQKVSAERLQATFDEMEFPELLDRSVASICVAFGYDPAAVGYPPSGGRFEYVKQAKASAWIDRILPFAAWLAGQFARGPLATYEQDRSLTWRDQRQSMKTAAIARRQTMSYGYQKAVAGRGRAMFAWFDDSSVPAVREAKLSLAKEGAIFIKDYKQPPADIIELFDLGLPTYDHQQTGWQTLSEMPIDGAGPGDDDEVGCETNEEAADTTEDDQGEDPDTIAATLVRLDLTDEQLAGLWRRWRASWSAIEKRMRGVINGHYRRLRAETLKNIDRLDPSKSACVDLMDYPMRWLDDLGRVQRRTFRIPIDARDLLGELVFDIVAADDRLLARARPLIRAAQQLGGDQTIGEVREATGGDADPYDISDPASAEALQRRDHRITGINKRVADRLRASLAEGISDGETLSDLAERVRGRFNAENPKLVAFQEVSSAVEEGRSLARGQADVPLKSWLWSRKETGRPSHAATEAATL